MQRLPKAFSMFLVAAAAVNVARSSVITIGSFAVPRANAPFTDTVGALGYGRLQAALLDPANFGPGGIVPCQVIVAPPAAVITDSYLSDKDAFVTGLFTGELSESEDAAIAAFVARGGVVIADCDSDRPSQSAASSLLSGIGTSARILGRLVCPNSSSAGTIEASFNQASSGPFGGIAGQSFAVSILASVLLDGRDRLLVTCSDRIENVRAVFPKGALSPNSGLVMYGGDPSGTDYFTDPRQELHNKNNLILYLNALATACGAAGACPYTRRFWRANPDRWPVSVLTLGCQSYEQAELEDLLALPGEGDASLILAQELIAQKLSVANGADPAPIATKAARADDVLCRFSGRLPFGIMTALLRREPGRTGGPGIRLSAGSDLTALAQAQELLGIASALRGYNHRKLTRNCQASPAP